MKPNKKNIRKWVAALRSGDYTQTTGMLHRLNDGYCCLGVACEISGIAGWEMFGNSTTCWYSDSSEDLPDSVVGWLGIEDRNPTIREYDRMSAAELNDNGCSFSLIADMIEQKYLK